MSTQKTIREFIGAKLLSDQRDFVFSDNDSLIDTGVIDSFGIMALLGFVEERFAIKVSGDDLLPENFDSVHTLSGMIDKLISRQAEE